jgi:hypothetical protein
MGRSKLRKATKEIKSPYEHSLSKSLLKIVITFWKRLLITKDFVNEIPSNYHNPSFEI